MQFDMELARGLDALLKERSMDNADVRARHGKDESYHEPQIPDRVVYPITTEEVSEIVRLCVRARTPMIPFGVGTSLEGHIGAARGGVCIDMSLMNQIIAVNATDLDCRVQAGVTRKQLNQSLLAHGQFFPVDPGADATIGGMTATRASGTNAVRYGTMKENVLGLTVVLPDASVVRTGGRARKSAAGYDLTHLMCGSEGTLGIITEIQLRCHGLPESHAVGVCSFPDLKGAVDSVIGIIQCGIPIARVELLDDVQMDAVNRYSHLDHKVQPTLFFEFHGTLAGVREQGEQVSEIVQSEGGSALVWSTRQEDQNRLWQARHDAYYAARALRPGAEGWPTDVCVPLSRLTECILESRADVAESGILAPIVGHVGDGNFHMLLLVDPANPKEVEVAGQVNDRLVKRAIGMGGTCTGEHGIGHGKRKYMMLEHGAGVEVMRTIKRAFDPLDLMNPGKVLPAS